MTWPAPTSKISQEYGANFKLPNGQWAYAYGHNGMDFAVANIAVLAPAPLRITETGWDNTGFGYYVRGVDPWGFEHLFGHLDHFLVSKGQQVNEGQALAITDNSGFSTGPHLHWSVRAPGAGYYTFINPRTWIERANQMAPSYPDLSVDNHIHRVEAIRGLIFRITGNVHDDADITKYHLHPELPPAAAFQRILSDFYDVNPAEYRAAGLDAYEDAYGKATTPEKKKEYEGEVEKKRAARIGIPQLRAEIMNNLPKAGNTAELEGRIQKAKDALEGR